MNKVLITIAVTVAACGGGGDTTAPMQCQHPFGSITQACSDCRVAMCDSENIACLGPDYKNGNFTGPCAALVSCTCACAAGAIACVSMCASKDTPACDNCNAPVLTCDQKCAAQCGVAGTADMAVPVAGNCAALSACCPQLPSNEQSACTSAAASETDAQCASTLSGFQSAGQCH